MNEKHYIQELAKQNLEYAMCNKMQARRKLWSEHHSMNFTTPPIYIRAIPIRETITSDMLKCTDPYYRSLETNFLLNQYRMTLDDDYIIEPYHVVRASFFESENGVYGVNDTLTEKTMVGGAAGFKPSIVNEEDIEKIKVAKYEIDTKKTDADLQKAHDTFGGVIDIALDRQAKLCTMWNNDIATVLAKIRGMEEVMWDIYDRPEWLLRLVGIMQESIIKSMDETQAAGGFSLVNHQNQAMPYANELEPPSACGKSVTQKELWGYMAAQEFTSIGPKDFKEFMFDFQKPMLERYGLVAYGCCEDMSQKIEVVKSLKNLRRIAVSPFSDVRKCAEQIGGDYIASWRPNPSSAVSRGIDEEFIRAEAENAFNIFDEYGCKFDITLKDVETVANDKTAIVRWTEIIRDQINRHYK